MSEVPPDRRAPPNTPVGLRDLAAYPTPARLLAVTAMAVFVGEVIVMLVLAVVPEVPTLTEAFLDGLMITILATPVLLLFLFRPMVRQIEQRRAAEAELQLLNDELERRVEERTRELTTANEQLRREMADRLTAEAGLSRSDEFIRRVLAAAPCLLAIYDVNSLKCSFVNERVGDLLGYQPHDVLMEGPEFFETVFQAEDLQRFRELNMAIAAGVQQGITTCRCRLRTGDGSEAEFGIGLVVLEGREPHGVKDVLLAAVPTTGGWPA